MTPIDLPIILTSAVIAALRVAGFASPSYQAIAHLWVGGLFGAYAVSRKPIHLVSAVTLSVVELIAFLTL